MPFLFCLCPFLFQCLEWLCTYNFVKWPTILLNLSVVCGVLVLDNSILRYSFPVIWMIFICLLVLVIRCPILVNFIIYSFYHDGHLMYVQLFFNVSKVPHPCAASLQLTLYAEMEYFHKYLHFVLCDFLFIRA